MDDGDAGGHLRDGVVGGHVVVTQNGELSTTVQGVGSLLFGFRRQGVDVVLGQISALGEEVAFAVVGGVHVLVKAARHTLTVAFRHDTVGGDTFLQDEEVHAALGTFLRQHIVLLLRVTRVGVGTKLNHDGRVLYHNII